MLLKSLFPAAFVKYLLRRYQKYLIHIFSMEPVFHSRTKKQIESFLASPSHGVVLSGREGSGKYFTAAWLASKMEYAMFTVESPDDKSTISIDQIRDLYTLTRTGSAMTIVIKDAQQMSTEAQNAFLKLLEEPPKNTTFILTVTKPESLLQTVRSRTQEISILPPSSSALLNSISNQANATSLLHTSENLPGKFFTLTTDTEAHEKHQATIEEAKRFYSGTIYQRHILCIENKYEKEWSRELLKILAIIIRTLLKQAATNNTEHTKLVRQTELLETTAYNLHVINGNPKIHLAKLAEQLG
jgi:DNA polymerase-3 subunit delta'